MTHSRGMLCGLAAFFLWVVVDVIIKLSSEASQSPFTIMAILGTVGAVSVAARAVSKGKIVALLPCSPREQFLICFCSIVMNYSTIIALKHLPLTIFYIVVFVAPMVIAALSAFFKHETLTRTKIACLIAGFMGVFVAMASHGNLGGGEWLGYIAGFISVLFFAVFTITMRRMPQTDKTVTSNQFLVCLSSAVVGIMGSLNVTAMPEAKTLAMMVIAGFINILGNILYNKALQKTSSTNIAQIHYTQIVSGAILGYLIWHEIPTGGLVAGSLIIIGSGLVVAAQAHGTEPEPPLH